MKEPTSCLKASCLVTVYYHIEVLVQYTFVCTCTLMMVVAMF